MSKTVSTAVVMIRLSCENKPRSLGEGRGRGIRVLPWFSWWALCVWDCGWAEGRAR